MNSKEYEENLNKLMEKVMAEPPPSFRVIAKFGSSNYDITITKDEEADLILDLLIRFRKSITKSKNLF